MARARTIWEEGREPGRLVVALGIAIAFSAVALDLVVNREITWLFDIAFVVGCVTMALRVRPADFFAIGVLPPLLMLGIFVVLGIASPGVIADPLDGTIQSVVTGLAHHAGALVTGYGLCLGALAMRQHVYRKRREAAAARRRAAARTQVPQQRMAPGDTAQEQEPPVAPRPVVPRTAAPAAPSAALPQDGPVPPSSVSL